MREPPEQQRFAFCHTCCCRASRCRSLASRRLPAASSNTTASAILLGQMLYRKVSLKSCVCEVPTTVKGTRFLYQAEQNVCRRSWT